MFATHDPFCAPRRQRDAQADDEPLGASGSRRAAYHAPVSKRPSPFDGSPTIRIDAVVPPTGNLFEIGAVLNDTYELRGMLGQGGMGQVYDAYDRYLSRPVAIKVAWPTVGASAVRKEAQALAAIRHPSMVVVYASGTHAGTEYVVMERVPGLTLASHIRRRVSSGKPFLVPEAVEILSAVAEGLAAVHRAGIAHRDVKPDNVMLAPSGRVVIMDFGVFVPEFAIAAHTVASGSPAYMAPETISGTVGGGGGFLVDVYALGVMAFELLTGELPFPGVTAPDVYMKHLSAQVPTVRSRRSEVPLALDHLVSALMTKDPSERPQNLDDVAHQLRAMLVQPAARTSQPSASSASSSSRRSAVSKSQPAQRAPSGRVIVEETPRVPQEDDEPT